MESVEAERDALVSQNSGWAGFSHGQALIEMRSYPGSSYRFNLVNHNYHGVDTSKYGEQK
jgi:hypothetical protein